MILGHIKDLLNYKSLFIEINIIVNFLNNNNLNNYSTGRYNLESGVFFILSEYETKEKALIENHQQYIDLQIILTGKEMVGYQRLELTDCNEYDSEKDISFYGEPAFFLPFIENHFMIFHPFDGHAPGVDFDSNKEFVKKVVFKIPVNKVTDN